MHDRGITRQFGFHSQVDMLVQLRQLLEEGAGQPLYAALYWPAIDTICHFRGPDHPAVGAELMASLNLLKSEVLDQLSAAARKETAFIITGDHGHVATPPELAIPVQDHPVLEEMLLMRPAGEPRTAYLYARQGCQKAIVDYLNEHLSDALVAFPANQVLSSGLLGPKPHAPDVARRLGDVVVMMRKGYTLLSRKEAAETDRFIGLHGGMTIEEMEIPWLLLPADG
jgi:predicted AlkP superfamily pyrophosphatase or phosphodiesterase